MTKVVKIRYKERQELIKFSKGNENVNEIAFRRWLVMEIHCGRMTIQQAVEEFEFEHKEPRSLIYNWLKAYAPEIPLSLPLMTEKERRKVESLEKQVKKLEKQLEESQMKVTALDIFIDIAEKKLNVPIRKKFGTKQ
jgi:hypothetical protein